MKKNTLIIVFLCLTTLVITAKERPRDLGIKIGVFKTGKYNAITDVQGVKVGHTTLIEGDHIRTGVTAIVPHSGNIFQQKVPAAIHIGNGFGKLAGYSQVKELGNLETPIILTNTLSVPTACNALISYTLAQKENQSVRSVNPLVGETNDGWLNDIRGRHINEDHILNAIKKARSGKVEEGNVGAGTGTICFGYKGGIGTASRVLPESLGGYTIGVLVQTNFGGKLEISGVQVAEEIGDYYYREKILNEADGSCMIVVLTDAPLDARNLERLAKRAMLGLGKTGGIASNGSGDYVIAASTAKENFIPYDHESALHTTTVLLNDNMSSLFMACIEATEEAIINSLFAAESMIGRNEHKVDELPVNDVISLLKKHNMIKP